MTAAPVPEVIGEEHLQELGSLNSVRARKQIHSVPKMVVCHLTRHIIELVPPIARVTSDPDFEAGGSLLKQIYNEIPATADGLGGACVQLDVTDDVIGAELLRRGDGRASRWDRSGFARGQFCGHGQWVLNGLTSRSRCMILGYLQVSLDTNVVSEVLRVCLGTDGPSWVLIE